MYREGLLKDLDTSPPRSSEYEQSGVDLAMEYGEGARELDSDEALLDFGLTVREV